MLLELILFNADGLRQTAKNGVRYGNMILVKVIQSIILSILNSSSLDFTIDNDMAPQNATVYRFNLTGGVSWSSVGSAITRQSNGTNKYKYTITGVDENPTFLKFSTN